MKYIKDWEKSLNIEERFSWATLPQKKQIMSEIMYQREQGALMLLEKIKSIDLHE